jgi:hypothetical protein
MESEIPALPASSSLPPPKWSGVNVFLPPNTAGPSRECWSGDHAQPLNTGVTEIESRDRYTTSTNRRSKADTSGAQGSIFQSYSTEERP